MAAGRNLLSAFVLHRYAWSESSLVLDLFTRDLGRIAVAAKGAKRPYSQLRSVLLPFQRIQVSLGRQPEGVEGREVQNLRSAEWVGGATLLRGAALFSGFYLNELLLRLMARHDPDAALFDIYDATLAALSVADDGSGQAALRAFELMLLRQIGLLPDLGAETATRRPVEAGRRYHLLADSGVAAAAGEVDATIDGAVLLALQQALARSDLALLRQVASASLGELRAVLRTQLHYHLGTDALRTRRVMLDAQALDARVGPGPAIIQR